jgi:hypothetical protein
MDKLTEYHPSAKEILSQLSSKYPHVPFLALGQTIWWDEPMKAILPALLDALGIDGHMTVGVHDTDYFARVGVRLPGQSRYELLPHNDGSTRDLWSAAGEISRLFGSESYPTRHDFARYGVPFNRVVRSQDEDRLDYINRITEAWGWRGLVYTGRKDLIVHNIPLHDMENAVERMLDWGFTGAQENIAKNCCDEDASDISEKLTGWVKGFRNDHPDATLSDLYQTLLPRLYELLLGQAPQNMDVACTAHMLRLTPETAKLPRFQFVELFLNEKTRAVAVEAYNHAVRDSEMYTLDRFGLGALPFDLVLPEHGRGTLRVTLRAIHVETPNPIRIPLQQPINSVAELAEILTRELGNHVTLVGKAVALISMLAHEFVFVFNEEGSGYIYRTRNMNRYLQKHGINVSVHPVLRMRYHTWDALGRSCATLTLPDHLARTFGCQTVSAPEFALSWKDVVEEQTQLLKSLKAIRKPVDLMEFLSTREREDWGGKLEEYKQLHRMLRDNWEAGWNIHEQIHRVYKHLGEVKRLIVQTEKAKGDHFRSVMDWTDEENKTREAYSDKINRLLEQRRDILEEIGELCDERSEILRGEKATLIRSQIDKLETEAEMTRMSLVRDALLTKTGLIHTQHRPAAWWLPMVDPCGNWFRRVAETTELYLEDLI